MLPKGHDWGEYLRNDDPFWHGVRSSLVAFVSIGPRFTPKFIGTGFIIGTTSDGFLLALTAKHVVEEGAIQVQKADSRRPRIVPHVLFEPELPLIGPME